MFWLSCLQSWRWRDGKGKSKGRKNVNYLPNLQRTNSGMLAVKESPHILLSALKITQFRRCYTAPGNTPFPGSCRQISGTFVPACRCLQTLLGIQSAGKHIKQVNNLRLWYECQFPHSDTAFFSTCEKETEKHPWKDYFLLECCLLYAYICIFLLLWSSGIKQCKFILLKYFIT